MIIIVFGNPTSIGFNGIYIDWYRHSYQNTWTIVDNIWDIIINCNENQHESFIDLHF